MPTNISRFFNTSGLVKNSFLTQNLLKKENECLVKEFNEEEANSSEIKQIISKHNDLNHPEAMYECLVESHLVYTLEVGESRF